MLGKTYVGIACRLATTLVLILNIAGTCIHALEDGATVNAGNLKCKHFDRHGCAVYLHGGNPSEYTVGLKRYNAFGAQSAIQVAAVNHALFKKGNISFAHRNGGIFGSIGYSDSSHGHHGQRINTRRVPNNLRMPGHLDYGRYIPIHETKDSLYIGEIRIGTPPQVLRPIFDTGSTNMWVVGTTCKDSSCEKVSRYDASRSSTFRPMENPFKIHVKFGTGEIEGYPATDTVAIGGMIIPNQSFAVVESEQSSGPGDNIFDKIRFEGIVGLAFPEMSSVPGTPIFDHMVLLKNMGHKEFAFYIDNDDEDSKIMFGGVDSVYYQGEIKLFPVVREHYWEVKLDAIYVGDEQLCCTGDKAYLIFDSGTSLNTIPSATFDRFMSYFNGDICNETLDGYPTITYVLSGEHITLEPQQYMLKHQEKCIPAYMQLDVPSEFGNAFIVGSNAFMKHYLTVFRRGDGTQPSMVGIAASRHR